ncbi:hypothetical protein [Deinococcus sp. UYEF24]
MKVIVAGAFALAAHGHPRYTKDLDIWIELAPENAERIVAALRDFGMESLGLTPADFLSESMVVQLGYEPNRIDLLTTLDGVTFSEAYPRRVLLQLADYTAPVLDLETLKVNKRASGRLRDLADLEELES